MLEVVFLMPRRHYRITGTYHLIKFRDIRGYFWRDCFLFYIIYICTYGNTHLIVNPGLSICQPWVVTTQGWRLGGYFHTCIYIWQFNSNHSLKFTYRYLFNLCISATCISTRDHFNINDNIFHNLHRYPIAFSSTHNTNINYGTELIAVSVVGIFPVCHSPGTNDSKS